MAEKNQKEVPETNKEKSSNLMPMIVITVIVVIVVGVFAYFAWNQNKASKSMTEETTPTQESMMEGESLEEDETATDEGDALSEDDMIGQSITVEGGNYYFKPNEIRVKQGDTVKITFTNAGGTHSFVIDEFDVQTKTTESGEAVEIEFVADRTGEFEFYCGIANHRQLGMTGTLIVE